MKEEEEDMTKRDRALSPLLSQTRALRHTTVLSNIMSL